MEKPWRLHVANSAIQHLDIIPGDPALLAVWTRDGQAAYYDLERGAAHGTSFFTLPEKRDDYWPFIVGLKDPKGRRLNHARAGGMSFWAVDGGGVMEYFGGAAVDLYKSANEMPLTLTFDVKPSALAIDPETQLVAALDAKGALLLGKPGGAVKTLKPGLTPVDELPLSVAVARGGKRMVVSDGAHLIVIDSGKVSSRRDLHYACGLLALSPDGERLLTFDADSGVVRAYVPEGLRLTHQRFVIDLMSSADELQLTAFAELPPVNAALSALTLDNEGRFALAVSGQICAASIRQLSPTDSGPVGGKPVTHPNADPMPDASKNAEKPAAKALPATGGTMRNGASKPPPKPAVSKSPDEDTAPIDEPPKDNKGA